MVRKQKKKKTSLASVFNFPVIKGKNVLIFYSYVL